MYEVLSGNLSLTFDCPIICNILKITLTDQTTVLSDCSVKKKINSNVHYRNCPSQNDQGDLISVGQMTTNIGHIN
jgi:hypothetical protein